MDPDATQPPPESPALLMLREQIQARGVKDERVLGAMARVDRAAFVPPEMRVHAYEDRPLPIGDGQTISQPYMVARMTALLALAPTARVLEIGTGSGYQTAVLAELAAEVVSVERQATLAHEAADRLLHRGYRNVTVHHADGTLGWPAREPYDAILVTAAAPALPKALLGQLADGGRLVCPVGSRAAQQLEVITRRGAAFNRQVDTRCIFVPLLGKQGWPTP